MFEVTVTIYKQQLKKRLNDATNKTQIVLSNQVLKDSNFYCKQDSSELITSSIKASDIEKGILRWRTPYARRQYYLTTAYKDKNPNASWMWFHKAKSINNKNWISLSNKAYGKYFGG